MDKLFWCCAECGHVEDVGEGEYEEGDVEDCVNCTAGDARVTMLKSADDFVGGR